MRKDDQQRQRSGVGTRVAYFRTSETSVLRRMGSCGRVLSRGVIPLVTGRRPDCRDARVGKMELVST